MTVEPKIPGAIIPRRVFYTARVIQRQAEVCGLNAIHPRDPSALAILSRERRRYHHAAREWRFAAGFGDAMLRSAPALHAAPISAFSAGLLTITNS
jgi:hypothetical protein